MSTIRINIGQRLAEGRQLLRAEYKQQDAAKLGVLRAGNSGIMSVDGEVAGSCHRVAHLRQLGLELDPPDDKSLIMFQVGTSNEDIVYEDLRQTKSAGEIILREEEVPIEWVTSNGTKVTGRPDMVICRQELRDGSDGEIPGTYNVPLLCLELKSVASVWTTRTVLIEGEPKLAHLAQVAHYMWKLGTPGRLVYKQYALQAMPDFAHRFFPRKGQPGSEYLEYGRDNKPKAVRPFEIVYELEFDADFRLRFRREGSEADWQTTIVSTADINRFYEYVSTMAGDSVLGQRPLTLGWDGEPKRYSNCGYCPLEATCDAVEKLDVGDQYVAWLSEARKLIASRSEVK